MSELERIQDQLHRALYGDAWHGDSVFTLLGPLTDQEAFAIPPGLPYSIGGITLHIATWLEIARRRLTGETVDPTPAEDWPDPGNFTWDATRERLRLAGQQLEEAIPAALLDAPVGGKPYNNYILLHGVIQHTLYHAGQIALIRRLI